MLKGYKYSFFIVCSGHSPVNVYPKHIENHHVLEDIVSRNVKKDSSSSHINETQEIYLTSKKCENFDRTKAQERHACPSIYLKSGMLNFTDIQLKDIHVITMNMKGKEGQIDMWRINEFQNMKLHVSSTSQQDNGMYVLIKDEYSPHLPQTI